MKEAVLYPLRRLHGFLHDLPDNYNERKKITKEIIIPIKQFLKEYPSAVFLVLTPEHGNLGDHAIAFAETRLLKNANIPYFEITGNKLNMLKKHKLLRIMNGHTVLINGGGNMGTLWFDVEQIHRAIIKENSRSPIFIMPNTIYYENSPLGESELKKSIAIYNKHNKLTIFAREKTSFDIMKSLPSLRLVKSRRLYTLRKPFSYDVRIGWKAAFASNVPALKDLSENTRPSQQKLASFVNSPSKSPPYFATPSTITTWSAHSQIHPPINLGYLSKISLYSYTSPGPFPIA